MNAEDIFRSSIGCEIMLMIKVRFRLIFTRYTQKVIMDGREWLLMAFKRVLKMVESQGKVCEKLGDFEMDIEWKPCLDLFSIHLKTTVRHLNFKLLKF